MKWLLPMLTCCVLLCGCSGGNRDLERGMQLRDLLLEAEQCQFHGNITADYGNQIYTFGMTCETDREGDMRFCVTAPEAIAGIAGVITQTSGMLTFDDSALQFSLLADGQLSPVAAPWIFMKTLRSGYLTSVCTEGELLRLTLNDSYEDGAVMADIWVDADLHPVHGDFLYEGKRILSLDVEDFQIR